MMSSADDDFARLGLPRRAALTAAEVRTAFQKAAAAAHPDHSADAVEKAARTDDFTKLNEASARLSATTTRLKHLLALEYPGHAGGGRSVVMDDALVSLFSQVGGAVQAAAQWAARQRAAATFLAKAALAGDEMLAREGLETAGEKLRAALDSQQAALMEMDRRRAENQDVADELAALGQRAAFLEKWQAQLQSAWAGMFGAG
ncbi:MAG: hypothetical protein V4726_03565 [Verrucomicrobiota bacterium]